VKIFLPNLLLAAVLCPTASHATVVGYNLTVTTAYALADPFPDRLDHAFTEPDTGYFQITNTGASTFTGQVGDIAVSVNAGNLSFTSATITLVPGQSVSVAIPDDASDVGGFNGPAYYLRPGVEITLTGSVALAGLTEAVNLLVADANIHSGVFRTDSYGLTSDSFVLQGGDPWGFDTGDVYELSQADGVYAFTEASGINGLTQPVPEPPPLWVLAAALPSLWWLRRRRVAVRSRAG
jgi:hypothetical protein